MMMITIAITMKKITSGIVILVFVGMMVMIPLVGMYVVPIVENMSKPYQYLITIVIFIVLLVLYMGGAFPYKRKYIRRQY